MHTGTFGPSDARSAGHEAITEAPEAQDADELARPTDGHPDQLRFHRRLWRQSVFRSGRAATRHYRCGCIDHGTGLLATRDPGRDHSAHASIDKSPCLATLPEA